MIYKKPYAFFIKHFKLIHFILTALCIYIAVKTYNIIGFFNDYIVNDYSGSFYSGYWENYISSFLYLFLFLVLIGTLIILILFIYKKKPLKVYLSSIIYYLALILFINIIKNVMITMSTDVITAESVRIYRDLSMLSIFPQFYFIVLYFLRGCGINIKHFKFNEDLKELEVSDQDDDEVEITFNNDSSKLQRNIRRYIREFQYYVKENRFVFSIICLFSFVGLMLLIYGMLPKNYDDKFKQGELFSINNLSYRIDDSIITNLNYSGDIIEKDGYYLVVKLYIENVSNADVLIDYNKFTLQVGDINLYPVIGKDNNFIDYALKNNSNYVSKNSKGIYLLIYQLDDYSRYDDYQIKVFSGQKYVDEKRINTFAYIGLTPAIIDTVQQQQQYHLGDNISFKNSNLENSSLKLSNPVITSKYTYNYSYCIHDNCDTYKDIVAVDYTKKDKILLILDYNYNIDRKSAFSKVSNSVHDFANHFIRLRYLDGDNYVYLNVKDITPDKLNDKIVLETSKMIQNQDNLDLSIIIRNKEYIVNLTD